MKISKAGTRAAKTGQWTALLDCRGVNDISQNFTIIVHTKESKKLYYANAKCVFKHDWSANVKWGHLSTMLVIALHKVLSVELLGGAIKEVALAPSRGLLQK